MAESCYFIGKHRRRRIAVIQQHIHEIEPYRGDPALTLEGMDDQGHAIFASGDRRFMDTDSINHFWARIVGEKGQQKVGGNAQIAPIQQYLCDRPGECIQVRQGKSEYQIVVVDDDALAITDSQRLVRLFEEDIEQAHRWVESEVDPFLWSARMWKWSWEKPVKTLKTVLISYVKRYNETLTLIVYV